MLKPMTFNIDGATGKYEGMSHGNTWNGWQMPYFTREVAMRFMEEHNAISLDDKIYYDAQNDSFIWAMDDVEEEDFEHYKGVIIDGVTYYALGSGSWCWE